MRVVVSAPSRLHFSLVDLSGDLGRLDGGAGVALKLPRTVVVVEESETLGYSGPRADEVLPVIEKLGVPGKVKVVSAPPPHVGLGSTTSLLLSVAKALTLVNGINMNSRELAVLVGRGGTSGVGVAAFEEGGLIVDFGHDASIKKRPLPSGASPATPPPYLRFDVPEDWAFVVAFPSRGKYDERAEVGEFLKRTPIPSEESSKVARIMFMLLLPSIIEKDLEMFKKAINELQNVGFKKIEIELQDDVTREVMSIMRKITGASGLSSMGPAVYSPVPLKKSRIVMEELRKEIPEDWNLMLGLPDNEGASVK